VSERKGHPPLKHNRELAETFGINTEPDPPRELVQVAHIPTPAPEEPPLGKQPAEESEDRILIILREEMEELAVRLKRFGVQFTPSQQQSMIDYGMAVLAGAVGGGAIARRA